jgi:hypothetical protein
MKLLALIKKTLNVGRLSKQDSSLAASYTDVDNSSSTSKEEKDLTESSISNEDTTPNGIPSSIYLQEGQSKTEVTVWIDSIITQQGNRVTKIDQAIARTNSQDTCDRYMQKFHNTRRIQVFEARRSKVNQNIAVLRKLLTAIDKEPREEFYKFQCMYEQEVHEQLNKPEAKPCLTKSWTT